MSASTPSAAAALAADLESGDAGALADASFTITDLAREFDITPRAIRFYEDQGLLAPDRQVLVACVLLAVDAYGERGGARRTSGARHGFDSPH